MMQLKRRGDGKKQKELKNVHTGELPPSPPPVVADGDDIA